MEYPHRRVDRDVPDGTRPVAHRAGDGSSVSVVQSPARNAANAKRA